MATEPAAPRTIEHVRSSARRPWRHRVVVKVAAVVLAIAGCVAAGGFATARAESGPVRATVCELIAKPDAFRNQRVEVEGTIVGGDDVLALRDDRCVIDGVVRPMIWLTTEAPKLVRYSPNWTSEAYLKVKRAAPITHASANVAWVEPLAVSRIPEPELEALNAAIRRSAGREAAAVVSGRFDATKGGVIVEGADGRVRWLSGFGHLGGYACQIVIESFRLAGAGPDLDPPRR